MCVCVSPTSLAKVALPSAALALRRALRAWRPASLERCESSRHGSMFQWGVSDVSLECILQAVDLTHITPLKAHLVWQAL